MERVTFETMTELLETGLRDGPARHRAETTTFPPHGTVTRCAFPEPPIRTV